MILKRLDKNDIDKIIALEQENFNDGWNKEMFVSAFSTERFFVFGYLDDDKLVSFVSFSIALDTADIEGVCTHLEYRKQGLAHGLINAVEDFLKEKKVGKIFLEVREQNVNAIALYSKCNFKQISVRKKYYPNGENAIILCKEI